MTPIFYCIFKILEIQLSVGPNLENFKYSFYFSGITFTSLACVASVSSGDSSPTKTYLPKFLFALAPANFSHSNKAENSVAKNPKNALLRRLNKSSPLESDRRRDRSKLLISTGPAAITTETMTFQIVSAVLG